VLLLVLTGEAVGAWGSANDGMPGCRAILEGKKYDDVVKGYCLGSTVGQAVRIVVRHTYFRCPGRGGFQGGLSLSGTVRQ
jgi:hypothetical protein